MNIDKFIKSRPYLYHLTDRKNLLNIIESGNIYSCSSLVSFSNLKETEKEEFLSTKRNNHVILNVNDREIIIRDQQPLWIKSVEKCLIGDCTVSDYIKLINKRVFFWTTIRRLTNHYSRYKNENPVIIRLRTEDVVSVNNLRDVEICRLNSGASRPVAYYGGIPAPRGFDTFEMISETARKPAEVVEFTVLKQCMLPELLWTANSPNGNWQCIQLEN